MADGAEPGPPLPARVGDYLTLAKPGITSLILVVAVGGFVLADPRSIDLLRLATSSSRARPRAAAPGC